MAKKPSYRIIFYMQEYCKSPPKANFGLCHKGFQFFFSACGQPTYPTPDLAFSCRNPLGSLSLVHHRNVKAGKNHWGPLLRNINLSSSIMFIPQADNPSKQQVSRLNSIFSLSDAMQKQRYDNPILSIYDIPSRIFPSMDMHLNPIHLPRIIPPLPHNLINIPSLSCNTRHELRRPRYHCRMA